MCRQVTLTTIAALHLRRYLETFELFPSSLFYVNTPVNVEFIYVYVKLKIRPHSQSVYRMQPSGVYGK